MKKEDRVLIKKFLKYFRPYIGFSVLLLITILLSVGVSLIQPVLWSKLITSVFGNDLRSIVVQLSRQKSKLFIMN